MKRALPYQWNSRPLPALIGGGIFVLAGIVLMVGGWFWHAHYSSFLLQAAHANGTVVAVTHGRKNGLFPVFTFEDKIGRTYRIRSQESSNRFKVGDTIEVSYDPSSPHEAKITEVTTNYEFPFFVMAFGFVFAIAGVSNGWKQYRREQVRNQRRASQQAASRDRSKTRST